LPSAPHLDEDSSSDSDDDDSSIHLADLPKHNTRSTTTPTHRPFEGPLVQAMDKILEFTIPLPDHVTQPNSAPPSGNKVIYSKGNVYDPETSQTREELYEKVIDDPVCPWHSRVWALKFVHPKHWLLYGY